MIKRRSKKRMNLLVTLGFLSLAACEVAVASESSGFERSVKIDETFLQVQGRVAEENISGVQSPGFKLGVKATPSTWLTINSSVGSSSYLYLPNWSQPQSSSVSVIDLKAQVYTDVADFYAGQFLVPWGLEGTRDESELWLPRSLFYEKGVFPLRDIGAGFRTDYDGYFMNLATHNGLGAGVTNNTARYFLTGQWGYHGRAQSSLGVSATIGHIAYPIVSQENKIRGVNLFYGFNIFGLGLQLEGSAIETRSDSLVTDSLTWHGDIQHPVSDHINLVSRFESYNPNLRVSSPVLNRIYLGCECHSLDGTSKLFIFAVKNLETIGENPNDEIQVAWRLSPKF
jgi:hypothetical protein